MNSEKIMSKGKFGLKFLFLDIVELNYLLIAQKDVFFIKKRMGKVLEGFDHLKGSNEHNFILVEQQSRLIIRTDDDIFDGFFDVLSLFDQLEGG